MTQPNETEGYSVADHVAAIQRHCGFRCDYVLAHHYGGISPRCWSPSAAPRRTWWCRSWWPTTIRKVVIFPNTPQRWCWWRAPF